MFYNALPPETNELLKELMAAPALSPYTLADNAALALQYGHRKATSLDFFGPKPLNEIPFDEGLKGFQTMSLNNTRDRNTFRIDGIPVDFVYYPHPWLSQPVKADGLSLAPKEDLAAMALAGLTNYATKTGFYDLYLLLTDFDLKTIVGLYQKKFNTDSDKLIIRAVASFEQYGEEEGPKLLQPISWEEVTKKIRQELERYQNSK